MTGAATEPVMFAYDGSELATLAIAEAAGQLDHGREALVVTVWQPFSVGFLPPRELRIDAAASDEVRAAAEQTAAQGASLAEAAGFRARSMAVEAAPTWSGIVEAADDHHASLIVLGSHGRTRLASVLMAASPKPSPHTRDGPCSSAIAANKVVSREIKFLGEPGKNRSGTATNPRRSPSKSGDEGDERPKRNQEESRQRVSRLARKAAVDASRPGP